MDLLLAMLLTDLPASRSACMLSNPKQNELIAAWWCNFLLVDEAALCLGPGD